MPSYPSDSIVHNMKANISCARHGCINSKLSGASMQLCRQCKGLNYCGRGCQRADWPRHKAWCKSQAARMAQEEEAGIAGPRVDCNAWQSAMGPVLFEWICVQGLGVSQRPHNIQTHFVVLSVRERQPRPSALRKLFTSESIEVFAGSALKAVLGGQEAVTVETREHIHRQDAAAKERGNAGAALLVVNVLTFDDGRIILSHCMPVVRGMQYLRHPAPTGWKDPIKDIINEGTNIKRPTAKREKAGELLDIRSHDPSVADDQ
ncbi:hypothetical protein B0H14DRAFT_2739711 [Mycena olivaceomarginata]|nr:hypothetical protein B0H14DRAFT_2739711 [Mycena olivaceomarginata]